MRSRRAVAPSFLKARVRDVSVPALTEGPLPSPGHDRRRVHPRPRDPHRRARGGRLDRRGRRASRRAPPRSSAPRRPRGVAVRIRRLQGRDFRRYRTFDIELAPGLTVIRGPNEAGKTTIQRALELALTRRATSAAGELEALRPWGAPPEARSIITIEFEQDDEDGQKVGTLEKTFAGSKGTVTLDYEGQSITDPTLADQVMAELTGIPTEGLLPFDGVGPPLRAERPDPRRGRPARPPPGVDQRRRPRHEPGPQEARQGAPRPDDASGERNPGRLKVAEQAVEPGRRPRSTRASWRSPSSSGTATRCRVRATDVPSAESALAERRSLLDKARQAERIGAERDAASEKYERYRQAVDVAAQVAVLAGSHPSPNPLAVLRAVGRAAAHARRPHPRAEGGARGRGRGQLRRRARADLAAHCRGCRSRSSSSASCSRRRRSSPRPSASPTRASRSRRSAASSRSSAWSSPASPCGCAGATGCRRRCATSRSTGGCAAARTWKPS